MNSTRPERSRTRAPRSMPDRRSRRRASAARTCSSPVIRAVTSRATPSSAMRVPSSAKIGALRCSVQRTDPSRRTHLRTRGASSSSAVAAAKDVPSGISARSSGWTSFCHSVGSVEELGGAVPRDGLRRRAHILEHWLRRQPGAIEDVRTALDEEAEAGPAVDRTTLAKRPRNVGRHAPDDTTGRQVCLPIDRYGLKG